jgi:hypothetical protein
MASPRGLDTSRIIQVARFRFPQLGPQQRGVPWVRLERSRWVHCLADDHRSMPACLPACLPAWKPSAHAQFTEGIVNIRIWCPGNNDNLFARGCMESRTSGSDVPEVTVALTSDTTQKELVIRSRQCPEANGVRHIHQSNKCPHHGGKLSGIVEKQPHERHPLNETLALIRIQSSALVPRW